MRIIALIDDQHVAPCGGVAPNRTLAE